jgi:serine/threonine protein phosphatase 1
MLEQRAFEYKAHLLKGKTVIHGHHVAYFQDIKNDIENRNKIIHLDNGCVYSKPHKVYDHLQTGNLLCLELNTWDLTVVKNCENE